MDGEQVWGDLRAEEAPAWGYVSLKDRGGRERGLVPWFSPRQVGEVVAARAQVEIDRELAEPLTTPRVGRKKRDETGALVEGPWKPKFRPLKDRAQQHEHCVALDLEGMPRQALQEVTHETCETVFIGPRSCDLRACPRCNGRRYEKYLSDVEAWLAGANVNWKFVRLLTLTIPNVKDLSKGVDHLLRDIKLLRRRPFFKKQTQGGVVAIQWTKYGPDWHVHAHLVLVGRYIDRDEIVDAWADIRGIPREGSVGVDIRAWKDRVWKDAFKEALGYVYPSKPRFYPKLEDFATVEVELRGRRLVTKFGSLYKVKAPREPRCCTACLNTDSHWSHRGTPLPVDHAAFVAVVTSETYSGEAGRLVAINRTRKAVEVNPKVRVARRRFESATRRENDGHAA